MVTFIYSRYINPSRSLFVTRYFISNISCVFLLAAVGVDILLENIFMERENISKKTINVVAYFSIYIFLLFPFIGSLNEYDIRIDRYTYRQATELIKSYDDMYEDDVLIVCGGGTGGTGIQYYFTDNWENPEPRIINYVYLTTSDLNRINRIYLFQGPIGVIPEKMEIIQSEFTLVEYFKAERLWVFERTHK